MFFGIKKIKKNTLIFATHGIIKKTNKTPQKEIEKAEQIRLNYFELKNKRKNDNKK
ncbi:MAG: type II toxin-antitoxin system RelE/ParE family toxin [Chitinophagales bacterium]